MAKSLEVSFFGPPCISENSKIWLKCRWLSQFLADFQLISFTDTRVNCRKMRSELLTLKPIENRSIDA